MPTLLKLTKALVAREGDYLVVNGKDVRVVPAEVLDIWLRAATEPRSVPAPAVEAPPPERESREPHARKRGRSEPDVEERRSRVLEALKAFPEGLTPPEIARLLARDSRDYDLIAHSTVYQLMNAGLLERESLTTGRFRRKWRYKLKEAG